MRYCLEIIILHMGTENYHHVIYGSWDMVCERRTDRRADGKSEITEVGAPPKNRYYKIHLHVKCCLTYSSYCWISYRIQSFKWNDWFLHEMLHWAKTGSECKNTVEWLTNKIHYSLFPAGTTVRDSHHRKYLNIFHTLF